MAGHNDIVPSGSRFAQLGQALPGEGCLRTVRCLRSFYALSSKVGDAREESGMRAKWIGERYLSRFLKMCRMILLQAEIRCA